MSVPSARPARRRRKSKSATPTETDLSVQPPVPRPPALDYKDGSVAAWWFRRVLTFLSGATLAGVAIWMNQTQGLDWALMLLLAGLGCGVAAISLLDKPYWVFVKQNPLFQAAHYNDEYTHTKAVGVTFSNEDGSCRQWIVRGLRSGDTLLFIWDRWNRHSRHAIAILTLDGRQVGYMRDEMASRFQPLIRRGVAYHVWVKAVTGRQYRGNAGVNIGIDELTPQTPEAQSVLWWASYATWRWRNRLPNKLCRWLFGVAAVAVLIGAGMLGIRFADSV